MIAALLLSVPAAAQDATADSLDVTTFRPSIGGRAGWWATDAGTPDAGGTARVVASYLRDPLTVRVGDQVTPVVQDVFGFDAILAYTWSRLRVGVDVPIVAYADGAGDGPVSAVGNSVLEAHGIVVPTGQPVGLAVQGRVLLPGSAGSPLSTGGVGAELFGVADHDFGPALVAANLGARLTEETRLPNVSVGDAFLYRLGATVDVREDAAGLSLDLGGQLPFADPSALAGNPLEAVGGAWVRVDPALVARAGVGRALTPGIGAPNVRAMVSLVVQRKADDDADDDGIVDASDQCPDVPEDLDGWRDDDGCPDGETEVRLVVVDADQHPITEGRGAACGTELPALNGTVLLRPGPCDLSLSAPGYLDDATVIEVPNGPPMTVTRVLRPVPPAYGALELVVTGKDGAPLDGEWSLGGNARPYSAGRAIATELVPGTWSVRVGADGYMPVTFPVPVRAGETVTTEVELRPILVRVTREKVEIHDKVYFDTNKATIKSESFGLLDDVAGVLLQRPEILAVRVEGHTDSRGTDASNQALSDARSRSVRDYLVAKGVAPERLTSQGYGESRPVDPRESPDAWDKNRRVEFVITRWGEEPTSGPGAP